MELISYRTTPSNSLEIKLSLSKREFGFITSLLDEENSKLKVEEILGKEFLRFLEEVKIITP